jgi:hypothetical protein
LRPMLRQPSGRLWPCAGYQARSRIAFLCRYGLMLSPNHVLGQAAPNHLAQRPEANDKRESYLAIIIIRGGALEVERRLALLSGTYPVLTLTIVTQTRPPAITRQRQGASCPVASFGTA